MKVEPIKPTYKKVWVKRNAAHDNKKQPVKEEVKSDKKLDILA